LKVNNYLLIQDSNFTVLIINKTYADPNTNAGEDFVINAKGHRECNYYIVNLPELVVLSIS
jgi:hypothetical protein